MLLLLAPLLSPAALAGGPCSQPGSAASTEPYRVVLLIDRSGSMASQGAGIAAARSHIEHQLAELREAPAGSVGVTLASFGSRVLDVWPAAGNSGSVAEALEQLPRFFPTDPKEYSDSRTCIYRSVFDVAAPELGVTSPKDDIGRPASWDFLVFTDGKDQCGREQAADTAAKQRWLDRNRAALRYKVWSVAAATPPDLAAGGRELLYSWGAPLQGVVNLATALPDTVPVPDPPSVTFFPRLIPDASQAACRGSTAPKGPPEVPFRLVGPDGSRVDQPGWALTPPPSGANGLFQARWAPGAVHLPGVVPEGRWTLSPDPALVCAALSAAAPGFALSPLGTAPGCATATFDAVRRPTVSVSATAGPLDRAVALAPGWFGRYSEKTVDAVISASSARSVRVAMESAATGPGIPTDADLCAGGTCGGEVSIALEADAPNSVHLRFHPRSEPWWPAEAASGVAGPTTGEQAVRLCVRADEATLVCPDCDAPPENGCVAIPLTIAPLRLHALSVAASFLATAIALFIGLTPRFHSSLEAGTHNLRRLHGWWRPLFRRPLYVVPNSRNRLELQLSAGGAVCELRPLRGGAQLRLLSRSKDLLVGGRPLLAKADRQASAHSSAPVTLDNKGLRLDVETRSPKKRT